MTDENVVKDMIVLEHGYYTYLRNMATIMLALQEAGVDNWEGYDDAMRTAKSMMEPDPAQQELDLTAGAQMEAAKYDDV